MSWSINGKHVVITGANAGIGRATALELARSGARLTLLGRSEDRTRPVLDELKGLGATAEFVPMDLASLSSVRSAAQALTHPIDVLLNNAGLAGQRGATADGFELAFGVNHLGHYLLTRLVMDRLSNPGRVINVASQAHYQATSLPWDAFRQSTRSFTGVTEYQRSKLCNVLFTKALVRRLPAETWTYSVHPGVVASGIWRRIPQPFRWYLTRRMISNEEGAQGSLLLARAVDPGAPTGAYFSKIRPKEPNPKANDEALREELWSKSAEWCGLTP